ncbi:MAG: septum formation initiator family protein [Bacteroidetes bacterium]|nr:MAG: septum formation initiator family protein [Bacteroidota bacterium]
MFSRFLKNLFSGKKTFYVISTLIFVVWMSFFDGNDLYSQYQLRKKLSQMEEERKFYLENIEILKQQKLELLKNNEILEKFARENYQMKKRTEDVYVIKKK